MMLMLMMAADASPTPGGDPHWSNVISLLHFDGADGSTSFPDETGRLWTPAGNVQIDTDVTKFGTGAGIFDGSGDYIVDSDGAAWAFTGDFTIEFFVRVSALARYYVCGQALSNLGVTRSVIEITSSGDIQFYNDTSTPLTGTSGGAIGLNVWHHVAVTRLGTQVEIWIDGVSRAQQTQAIPAGNTYAFHLGRGGSRTTQNFNGRIDEFRATKGVARYTANFTPPAGPFPSE